MNHNRFNVNSTGYKTTTENQFLHFEREKYKKKEHTHSKLNFVYIYKLRDIEYIYCKNASTACQWRQNYNIYRMEWRKRISNQSSTSRTYLTAKRLEINGIISMLKSKTKFTKKIIINMQYAMIAINKQIQIICTNTKKK